MVQWPVPVPDSRALTRNRGELIIDKGAMTSNWQDLQDIGFERIGHWQLQGDDPHYVLHRLGDAAPALYAFAIGGAVMYVGKTVRTLGQRLYGYKKGSGTQRTNIRVRHEIRSALQQGDEVDVLGFHDPKPWRLGRFTLNLPAALEDDIIRTLNPPWNNPRQTRESAVNETVVSEEGLQPRTPQGKPTASEPRVFSAAKASTAPAFVISVGQTYFRQGFFNVPRTHTHRFAADGRLVEIQLPGSDAPLQAKVNRRANLNGTPRIMGGARLRDWFQKTTRIGGSIRVRVQSKDRIDITPA